MHTLALPHFISENKVGYIKRERETDLIFLIYNRGNIIFKLKGTHSIHQSPVHTSLIKCIDPCCHTRAHKTH